MESHRVCPSASGFSHQASWVQGPSRGSLCPSSPPFHGCIVVHCVEGPHSVYPSIHHPSSVHHPSTTHSSTHPSIYPPSHPSIHPSSIHPPNHPFTHPSIHPSTHPTTRPSTHPTTRPSIHHPLMDVWVVSFLSLSLPPRPTHTALKLSTLMEENRHQCPHSG